MQSGQVVLVDTNIIIEAVRTNCWSAITAHAVGARTALKYLREQFKSGMLSEWRTAALLKRGLK